jgi:hypothetical protein
LPSSTRHKRDLLDFSKSPSTWPTDTCTIWNGIYQEIVWRGIHGDCLIICLVDEPLVVVPFLFGDFKPTFVKQL